MSLSAGTIRHAVRSLRQTPTTTIAALACIALGIGATAATFSAVDRALLTPPPYREPERLVTLFRTTPHFQDGPFAPANFEDLADRTRTLAGLAAVEHGSGIIAERDGSYQVRAFAISASGFELLGVAPLRGRLLNGDDGRPDAPTAVVLGEELWRQRFGADDGVIGTTIRLSGEQATVVGIVPRGFRLIHGGNVFRSDVWTALRFSPERRQVRGSNSLRLFGRLAPGATLAGAAAELDRLMAEIVTEHPELAGQGLRVGRLADEGTRSLRQPLWLLLGAVALVLLVASANVASLLLARGAAQRRELAIRSALGASQGDLIGGTMIESAVLVAAGAAVGMGLAWVGVRIIGALAAAQIPQLDGLTIDFRVALFALGLAAVVTTLCGLVPAWRASAIAPFEAMQSGARSGATPGQHRFLRILTVTEVALSIVLLIGSGLVAKGFVQLIGQPAGFETESLLSAKITVAADRYPEGKTAEQLLEPVLEGLRRIPGVREAGAISAIPYQNWGINFNIRYEGVDGTDPSRLPLVEVRSVSRSIFATLGVRLQRGRIPDDAELAPETPALVVANEALVRRDFPGRDPIGARFHISDSAFATIVGVVSDVKNMGPVRPPQPETYWFYRQTSPGATLFPVMIRVAGEPAGFTATVAGTIRAIDPTVAISELRPFEELVVESVGRPRFFLILIGVFAATALVLSAAGLYGVLSYVVTQQSREIGIRMALGGSQGRIVSLVVRRGTAMIATGMVIGLVAAAFLSRLLTSMLYGVSPLDRGVWLLVSGVMVTTGLAAVVVPARRAAAVAPMVVLKAG